MNARLRPPIPNIPPRPLRPGEERRILRSLDREDTEGAMVRATEKSWWPKVTRKQPYRTASHWIWTVRVL